MQGKLEEAVELLSEMVNRKYLNTPPSQMGEAARNVDAVCDEYLKEMREVANIAYSSVLDEKRRKEMESRPAASKAPPSLPPRRPWADTPRDPSHIPREHTPVPHNELLRSLESMRMYVDQATGRLHIYVGEGVSIPIEAVFAGHDRDFSDDDSDF